MATFFVLLVLLSALMHVSRNAFLHLSGNRLWLPGMMSVPYVVVSAIGVIAPPPPAVAKIAAGGGRRRGMCLGRLGV